MPLSPVTTHMFLDVYFIEEIPKLFFSLHMSMTLSRNDTKPSVLILSVTETWLAIFLF